MSELYRPAFATPTGSLIRPAVHYDVLSWGFGAPTNSVGGYEKGCVYIDATNGDIYRNTGSTTSSTWAAISGGGIALNTAMANAANTTVGAATLTAAQLVGGVITRSGSTAAYTDTTDTAAAIISALPAGFAVGGSWLVFIKNTVAFTETLAAGTGVTLSGTTIIPPNSMGTFLATYTAAGAVSLLGLNVDALTVNPLLARTNLTTVGAGTITAAGIVSGVTNRTGSTAAYTDTTDTGANIIAALPNANVGQSFVWTYYNNTLGNATLAAGDGNVTITGTLVPFNQWAEYLVTVATATTVTLVQIAAGPCVALPYSKLTVGTAATFNAGDITGAAVTHYENNASNATLTVRTAAQMFADIPNCQIGFTYTLFLRNLNATSATLAADGGATVTLSGTMTIAQNVTRMFNVTFPSATTCTITSMGIFAAGA